MSADQPHQGIALPTPLDEAAVAILDFLEGAIQIFEVRYGHQVHRYDDRLSRHNIVQSDPAPSTDAPSF